MKRVLDFVYIFLIMTIFFGGMAYVVWNFKWWILGGAFVFALIFMGVNSAHRKITGKNMKLYDRIMEEDKK